VLGNIKKWHELINIKKDIPTRLGKMKVEAMPLINYNSLSKVDVIINLLYVICLQWKLHKIKMIY
jgi:hypothetical protein